jgi:4-carboxymuconolactone decarboxylase
MTDRPPILDESRLTPEQQAVFDRIRSGPRGVVVGPLRVWLASPELADHAQALGAFCRYRTRLPPRLSELAILVIGAHWQSGFEWVAHAPIALKVGLAADAIEAIRRGREPNLVRADERAVYAFARELLLTKRVSSDSYSAAVRELGLEAAVELVGVLGYYTLIAMTINAFEVPVPEGAHEPFDHRAAR